MSLDELARSDPEPGPPPVRTADFARIPALDGVRAIAIVLVLQFHNYQTAFGGGQTWNGGFIGVDVFFVLSGFLITTLLLREHDRSERVDLPRFWSRRARRLLPALFVAIAGAALLAKFAYDPTTAANLRGESLATLLYVENWYRISSVPSALSHAWSLSVEEQWYVIWPLLLGFLLVVSRGRKRFLLAAVGVLAVASAIECALLFSQDPQRSYYGTDTRAQTLLIGAGLAFLMVKRPRLPTWLLRGAGWVGLAGIGWYFYGAHPDSAWIYRGGFLLLAMLSAALIASVAASQDSLLARALAWKPLAAIGLISYGLYLYHYPIYLWLDQDRTRLFGAELFGLRLAVTLLVATLSYFIVERPFRRGTTLNRGQVAGFALTGVAVAAIAFVATPSAVPSPIASRIKSFAQAADTTPNGSQRVFVVGGTPVFGLELGGMYDGNATRGVAFGMYGCDVTPGDPILGARRYPAGQACGQLLPYIRELTAVFDPAVGVLILGPEDARDRAVGSTVLHPGSDGFEQLVVDRLNHVRRSVTSAGARFVLLPVQCDGTTDVPAASVAWLDQVLARYARAHSGQLTYLPNVRQPCPGSRLDPKDIWPSVAAAIKAG